MMPSASSYSFLFVHKKSHITRGEHPPCGSGFAPRMREPRRANAPQSARPARRGASVSLKPPRLMQTGTRLAAVDLGSNSFRLEIAKLELG